MEAKNKRKLKVIVADDHKLFRIGLVSTLHDIKFITVIGEAADGREAVNLVEKHKPDVVFMDIKMPVLNGMEATAIIKKKSPDTKVIALSMHDNEDIITKMFESGADAYLLKNTDQFEIEEAIETVMIGEQYYSHEVSQILLRKLMSKKTALPPDGTLPLSTREKEVLRLISKGLSSKQVADDLCLSERTVEGHRKRLIEKTNSKNMAEAIAHAVNSGWFNAE